MPTAIVAQVRLRHVIAAFSCVHHGPAASASAFEGTSSDGRYVTANGEGDHLLARWSAAGIVLMAFDHESASTEVALPVEERCPERLFAGAPASLTQLVDDVTGWEERLGTAGWWLAAREDGNHTSGWVDESSQIRPYLLTPREAMDGSLEYPGWVSSLSRGQGRLAASLAYEPVSREHVLTEKEEAVLLSPPGRDALPSFDAENVRAAVEMLRELGIVWDDAVEHAERRAEAARNRWMRGDRDGSIALLHATARGDHAAMRALLEAGASTERRSREGEIPGAINPGETPLVVACTRKDLEGALLLLEYGADVNTTAAFYTPLSEAVAWGSLELCAALLDRGASFHAGPRQERPVFVEALRSQDPDVVRLLLDRGAPLPDTRLCERLARSVAERGAADLVPRLLPGMAATGK